jgi:hypothetical protein
MLDFCTINLEYLENLISSYQNHVGKELPEK